MAFDTVTLSPERGSKQPTDAFRSKLHLSAGTEFGVKKPQIPLIHTKTRLRQFKNFSRTPREHHHLSKNRLEYV